MAYINKKDFSIREFVLMNKFIKNDDYFECDDLIAPAISLLNKKGYKTKFSCSGHPYPFVNACLCTDPDENNYHNTVLEVCRASEIKDRLLIEFGYTEENLKELPCPLEELYCVVYKVNFSSTFYIVFDGHYDFPDLPSIFYFDKDNNGIYQERLMDENGDYIPTADETFEGMTLIYDTNKIFYNYVKNLKSLI